MKIISVLLTLLSLTSFKSSYDQNEDIYTVKFDFYHSRRIPHHHVAVDFDRSGDSVQVFVKSIPGDTVTLAWKDTRLDYSFNLTLDEFDKVVDAVLKIDCSDIKKGIGYSGYDGTVCKIEIGGLGTGISYTVWSPDYKTKLRGLQAYLDACKVILLTAKLDPKDIL